MYLHFKFVFLAPQIQLNMAKIPIPKLQIQMVIKIENPTSEGLPIKTIYII